MILENADALRDWLTKYLEPLCDADPIALAKYVMALIKKDKPEKDLKTVCLDQLEVFLQKETITFVDTLFETIANKSYLKSVSTPSATTAPTTPTLTSKPLTSETTPIVSPIETTLPVVKPSDAGNNSANSVKSSEQHIPTNTQTTVKTDSTHESSHRLRDKRNRSRSRSRSPLRSARRTEFDSRRLGPVPNRNNGNIYFNDDRRNRRGLPNRGARNQRFGGYRNDRNERDYRRPRELKRGRSRSRSRSYSTGSSRSRSPRSRSRERSWSRERPDRDSPSNKKSRPSSRPGSRSPSPSKAVPKDGEKSKKCRDYEEKGFCLKGHLCPYDHGNDPVVLDSNVSAALGFTNNGQSNAPLMPIPNSGIAPNAPNSYLAEPYNPEAPGMDPQRPHPPQGPPPMGPRMPPPPYWGPMPIRGPLPPGPPLPPHQFMPPPGRPRELIGVPTIDNNHRQSHSNRTVIEPNIPMGHRGGMRGGHMKHMGRGGYRNVRRINNETADKTCLEVRKIPSNMNTISHLNQHFSKFGTIVNLQVCHEGDPEAALVQYSSHGEALGAIRSTEAVLNNRFIKVFWHSKELQQKHEQTFGPKTEPTEESDTAIGSKVSIKDRLGPKISETESVLTAVNSSGTISRTVFDPSKLKKTNKHNNQKDISNTTETNSSQTPSDNNTEGKTKNPMTDKTNKKEIYSKQYQLLAEMIQKQKQLTTKLENSSTEFEKKSVKDMMNLISNKISIIQEDIKKQMSFKKATKKPETKEEVMAEILNIDMEMFLKFQNKDVSYVEMANKLSRLKKKEKAFFAQRRGAKAFPRRGRGLTRRGSFYGRGSNPLLKVDRRTRKLLIPEINEDDITDLLEHLAQFSDVEVIEPSSNGAVVTFKTRMDAEKAVQNIGQIKFKENCQLTYSWFDDNIAKSADKKSLNKAISTEPKTQNEGNDREIETLGEEELLDYEEDDTEDESEARNWKA